MPTGRSEPPLFLPGFIYVLRSEDRKVIKVGFTSTASSPYCLDGRLAAHRKLFRRQFGQLVPVGCFIANATDDIALRCKLRGRVLGKGGVYMKDWFANTRGNSLLLTSYPMMSFAAARDLINRFKKWKCEMRKKDTHTK